MPKRSEPSVLALLVFATCLGGCARLPRQILYDGPELPASAVAIIRESTARLSRIGDIQTLPDTTREQREYHVKPGSYLVRAVGSQLPAVRLEAQAGGRYRSDVGHYNFAGDTYVAIAQPWLTITDLKTGGIVTPLRGDTFQIRVSTDGARDLYAEADRPRQASVPLVFVTEAATDSILKADFAYMSGPAELTVFAGGIRLRTLRGLLADGRSFVCYRDCGERLRVRPGSYVAEVDYGPDKYNLRGEAVKVSFSARPGQRIQVLAQLTIYVPERQTKGRWKPVVVTCPQTGPLLLVVGERLCKAIE